MGNQAAQQFIDVKNSVMGQNAPLPVNHRQVIVKGATETRTANTALTADSDLQFPMKANAKYKIRLQLWFDTVAAADFKFQVSGPGSPTLVRGLRRHVDPTNLTTLVTTSEVALPGSTAIAAGTGTTGGYIEEDFIVHNGANDGTFSFDWAQNTSDPGNTSVLAGSSLEYQCL